MSATRRLNTEHMQVSGPNSQLVGDSPRRLAFPCSGVRVRHMSSCMLLAAQPVTTSVVAVMYNAVWIDPSGGV